MDPLLYILHSCQVRLYKMLRSCDEYIFPVGFLIAKLGFSKIIIRKPIITHCLPLIIADYPNLQLRGEKGERGPKV